MQTQVFTDLDQSMLDFFKINMTNNTTNFFGIHLAGFYHMPKNWSMGIDFESYYYNQYLYLFPTLDFKISKQITNSPIKISPLIGAGTNLIIPLQALSDTKSANFIKINAGVDFEMGLSKSVSFFASPIYNFSIPLGETRNTFKTVEHYNFSFGLRLNLQ
jgi:hypothetical protein